MSEKDTSRLSIFKGNGHTDRIAQWIEATLVSLEEVGMRVHIPAWHLPFFFFFLSLFFYPLAFYFLFSLLTLLASRDFCENVFLVNEYSLRSRDFHSTPSWHKWSDFEYRPWCFAIVVRTPPGSSLAICSMLMIWKCFVKKKKKKKKKKKTVVSLATFVALRYGIPNEKVPKSPLQ